MSYQVLARKWRPGNFSEMVGQEHVQRTLINALDNDQLHHAFLFTGTRGVGKTTIARILAKSLNCEKGVTSQPCGKCSSCQAISNGHFVDLIEVDAASKTKVEDTRELLENVQYTPSQGRYKVYLIDEVHMLSTHSFNALLKTLEEPPSHVKFLFATTDPQRLPVTILSRCLQFNLKRISVETISAYLANVLTQEKINADQSALQLIARAADGSMRDALSLVDQAIAYGKGQLIDSDVRAMLGTIDQNHVFSLLEALQQRNGIKLLETSQHIDEHAFDFSAVLAELTTLLHQVALMQIVPSALDSNTENHEKIIQLANQLSPEDIQLFYQIAILGRRDLPLAADLRSGFEMILLRMLSFRPVDTNQNAIKSPAVQVKSSSPVTNKQVTNKHTANQSNSPANSPATTSSIDEIASNPSSAPLNNANSWHTMVSNLNLKGLTLQLANHCIIKDRTKDQIHLQLDSAHKQLLNSKQQKRLEEAIYTLLKTPIKLTITSDDEIKDETPAQIQKKHLDERQQAAENAIHKDTNVQALIDTFDAKIDTKSIKPVD